MKIILTKKSNKKLKKKKLKKGKTLAARNLKRQIYRIHMQAQDIIGIS